MNYHSGYAVMKNHSTAKESDITYELSSYASHLSYLWFGDKMAAYFSHSAAVQFVFKRAKSSIISQLLFISPNNVFLIN